MKKVLSVLLVMILAFSCMHTAFAAGEEARLYTVYGDGMLFGQNKDAVLAGEASPDSVIVASLFGVDKALVAQGSAVTKADGCFEVSFMAPSGSYEEYTIELTCNGELFETLENVVFGELWLASGQSNMQYPLSQAKHGSESCKNGEKLSKWLRVLLVPAYMNSYFEIGFVPYEPLKDIEGATWVDGENGAIYGMSAVAYYFADEMRKELDMPVGILNASLGGSAIASWISRKAIDADAEYKNMLISQGLYKTSEQWQPGKQDVYGDMTANYNHKIEALKNFRPSGMIWYQGESDIGRSAEYYSKSLDVMQSSYTELFDYNDGLFPLIYTNLAEYFYSSDGLVLPDRNIAFGEMQEKHPESRATFGIYDLPITYLPEVGVIHPESKKEIGERMALCAKGMVYDKFDSHTSASVKNVEIKDGSAFVTLKNVGDGIVVNGEKPYGFAICGADGIYVQADAEIVSTDTIKVWNEKVANPVSVSYAYGMGNGRANLACTYEGEAPLPVNIFITDKTVGTHYWNDKRWADCESEMLWHTMTDTTSGFYSSWVGEDATVAVTADDAFEGENGLNVTAQPKFMNKTFVVKPLLTFKDGTKKDNFWDADKDYSDYGTMVFYIRNNGEKPVKLDKVKFSKNDATWYTPTINNGKGIDAAITPDGMWYRITLDLNQLYLHGNEGGVAFTNEKLKDVRDIELCFSGEKNDSVDISIDSFTFTPSSEDVKASFDASFYAADNLFEYFCLIVTNFLGLFAKIFR